MRKSSPDSSRDAKPGREGFFKKEGSSNFRKDAKPSFKKNYDGRNPAAGSGGGKSKPYSGRVTDGDKPKRSFDKPSFRKDEREEGGERKPFGDRPKRSFDKPSFRKDSRDGGDDRKSYSELPKRSFGKPTFKKDNNGEVAGRKPRKDFDRPMPFKDTRPFRERNEATGEKGFEARNTRAGKKEEVEKKKGFSDVVNKVFNAPAKKDDDDNPGKRQQFEDQVYGELKDTAPEDRPKKPYELKGAGKKKRVHDHSGGRKKKYKDEEDEDDEDDKEINQTNGPRLEMPLNKFIAHSGECSRRDAAELVKQGKVKVNGELVLDPGYRVKSEDKVTMSGKKLTPQKGMVYILLNKPKGFITTNDDPQGRKTVMELVASSGAERLFPVGRLDRDTSGLLLITNDGDLTQKLSHPAYNIKKVYQVTLDKPLTKAHFEKIIEGVELEDGKAIVDALSYLETKKELGLEIHSGRNRIVRRIFESLGYVVEKLDRVMYAGLTKKNLPRSKWRYLDEREVILLKHFKS